MLRAQAAWAQLKCRPAAVSTDGILLQMDEAMEATGRAAVELAGSALESQFGPGESGNDVDDELAAPAQPACQRSKLVALPAGEGNAARDAQPVKVEEVDAELEELKRFDRQALSRSISCIPRPELNETFKASGGTR